ncbi:MAG: peroxiredoxin [Marivirga sp.]|jgi:peroxiredoxin
MSNRKDDSRSRIIIASTFIVLCFSTIMFIFWKQEVKFTLPTPKPTDLEQIAIGTEVALNLVTDSSKITFIHYYNYDCPCSRFNINEFKQMYYKYKDQIDFTVVVQAADERKDAKQLFKEKYELDIKVIHDKNGTIAKTLGIYSTPQAIIIKNNQLYYRGNYNKARFCTSRNTKFAELALSAAINNEKTPWMPQLATVAYGCELPSNEEMTTINLFNF